MPGRFMADSIRCIQFSPVIRTPSRTKARSPQNVTKTLVRTPLAAAVDARIRTGQIRSRSPLQLTITNSLTLVSAGDSGASSVSGRDTGVRATGVSIVSIMAVTSLLPQDEPVYRTVHA